MSRRRRVRTRDKQPAHARVFAALGDRTRLALVAKVCGGRPRSISELTKGSGLTRQAITKHLRVLERARVMRSVRAGRETRFVFDAEPIDQLRKYLDLVSEQGDQSLARLKQFVES